MQFQSKSFRLCVEISRVTGNPVSVCLRPDETQTRLPGYRNYNLEELNVSSEDIIPFLLQNKGTGQTVGL